MSSTQDVLNHHMGCFGEGDLEGFLSDYTEDSVLEIPNAQIKGLDGLREVFTRLLEDFGKPSSTFEMLRLSIHGEFAYIVWKAQTADIDYHIGSDTFVVRDGKIVYQAFTARVTRRG